MNAMPSGWIEVLAGSMFSGKSEELIRRLRRAEIARRRIQVFKPQVDKRYGENVVASHIKSKFEATPIPEKYPGIILEKLADGTEIVGIDEAQFFDIYLVSVVNKLTERGIRVIIAGLNQDSSGKPFGVMPQLMAMGDEVHVLTAICTECGSPATKSQKLVASGSTVEIGETDKYVARCRAHFVPTK